MRKLLELLGLSLAAGALLCVAGCEDSARNVASYHPPVVQAPVIQAAAAQQPNLSPKPNPPARINSPGKPAPKIGALPLGQSHGRTIFLALTPPDAVNRLAGQVRTLFAAGEQEAKANHNDAARQDYDDALDLLLASGFNLGTEPELSELFNQIMLSLSSVQSATQASAAKEPPEVAAGQQNQPSLLCPCMPLALAFPVL